MNIICPINQLGYGISGLNILRELSSTQRVSLWPIGQPQVTTPEDAELIKNSLKNAQFFNYDDPCLRIWHQHDMSQFVGRGAKIGFPIFELDEFNNIEFHHLNYPDKIFVCSSWAKKIINNHFPSKEVFVIPLGVDLNIFKPSEFNEGNTIFFNCGKWEVRKGHDLLVKIFNDAFTDDDNVELWMMCDNPFLNKQETDEWKKLYTSSKLGYKVKFISRVQSHNEVYNTMSKVDCGVFPSKAEGWNLEPLELMACGKHVIITNYSAHTEFCNEQNSRLIQIDSLETAYDGKWFKSNVGNWAKFEKDQIDQTIEHMRDVHKLKQTNSLKINQAGIETSKTFTWSNTAKEILRNV